MMFPIFNSLMKKLKKKNVWCPHSFRITMYLWLKMFTILILFTMIKTAINIF